MVHTVFSVLGLQKQEANSEKSAKILTPIPKRGADFAGLAYLASSLPRIIAFRVCRNRFITFS